MRHHLINGDEEAWIARSDSVSSRFELSFLHPADIPSVIYALCRDARTQDIKGVTLGLYEAVANAVYHGNLELDSAIKETDDGFTKYEELANKRMNEEKYRNRRVIVSFEQNNGVIKYVVSDDGDGFNWRKIPEPDSEEMFSFPGRGIMLMKFYYHAVEWNEKGNEITLTYIPTSAGPAK